jgi:hypothetical protein
MYVKPVDKRNGEVLIKTLAVLLGICDNYCLIAYVYIGELTAAAF